MRSEVLGNLRSARTNNAVEVVEKLSAITYSVAGFQNSEKINRSGKPVNDYSDTFSFTDSPVSSGESKSGGRVIHDDAPGWIR